MGASACAGEDGAPFPHGTVLRVVVPKSALPLSAPSLRCRGQLLVSDLQLEIPVTSREDPEAAQTLRRRLPPAHRAPAAPRCEPLSRTPPCTALWGHSEDDTDDTGRRSPPRHDAAPGRGLRRCFWLSLQGLPPGASLHPHEWRHSHSKGGSEPLLRARSPMLSDSRNRGHLLGSGGSRPGGPALLAGGAYGWHPVNSGPLCTWKNQ